MSQQELKRVEVIALRRSGRIDQQEAARRLGLTVRQVRRLEAKVAALGAAGLRSRRRGRPSNNRLPPATMSRVSELIRTHYRDFGPTLATEYLQERHGFPEALMANIAGLQKLVQSVVTASGRAP